MDKNILTSSAKFPPHFQWLFQNGPSIPIINAANNINIINSPAQFHQTLINLSDQAQFRINLSALYLGTDDITKQLVNSIEATLEKHLNKSSNDILSKGDFKNTKNPNFKFSIICDHSRGTRYNDSTRQSIYPLKRKYPQNTRLSLYHTPYLRSWQKKVLPTAAKEIIGVHHCKIYIFDNDVIMSGANLSKIYFTNRTDRYIHFKDQPILANFMANVIQAFQKISVDIDENDNEIINDINPVDCDCEEFASKSREIFGPLMDNKGKWSNKNADKYDTWVFPTFQANQLGINHDSETITKLLTQVFKTNSKLTISTGYFNLSSEMQTGILQCKSQKINIISASESANGFYQAKGILGSIPNMYKHVCLNFVNTIKLFNKNETISLVEYEKQDWSFHAKGMWYEESDNGNDNFVCNIFGSSNFGFRSFTRDTECQLILVTKMGCKDAQVLAPKFRSELKCISEYCNTIDENRIEILQNQVPMWLKYISGLLKQFF